MPELVDPKTGQVYDAFAIHRQKRYARGTEFNIMFRDGWKVLADIDDLAGRDYRVFHKLMERLEFDNWVTISQETIAEELKLKRPHVTASIGKLVKHDIIERQVDPADKRRMRYRLNADLGWKGDAKQWAIHQQERFNAQFNQNVVPFPRNFDNPEPALTANQAGLFDPPPA